MMKFLILLAMAFGWILSGAESEFPAGIRLEPTGELKALNTSFQLFHFKADWRGTEVNSRNLRILSGAPETYSGKFELEGKWAAERELLLDLEERIQTVSPDSVACFYRVGRDTPFFSNFISLAWMIPVGQSVPRIAIDGKPLTIPAEKQLSRELFRGDAVRRIEVVSGGRTMVLTGDLKIQVVDSRLCQWKGPRIEIRLILHAVSGMTTWNECGFSLAVKPVENQMLDLKSACNMAFADEIAGDQQGGWSDQGAQNDMRKLPVGTLRCYDVDFQIVDPAGNAGKSCIVLSNRDNVCWPPRVALPVSGKGKVLYLLHAAGWNKSTRSRLGAITVKYKDGTLTELPVETARECGNWWMPVNLPNGAVVWRDVNPSAAIGLYMSQFELQDKALESIAFDCTERAMWMIVAASQGDTLLEFAEEPEPFKIVEGAEFVKLDFMRQMQVGSPLDFSRSLDAPAGKYGSVTIAPDGHFTFANAPEKRVRFNGVNLCMEGIFYSHKDAEKLADELAFNDYNSVRLHQYDAFLIDSAASDTVTFDAVKLDQLDYLIAALKKRGIYLTLDLYNLRRFKVADGIRDVPWQLNDAMRSLIAVSPEIQRNWKQFSRNLLDRVNPYTKMRLADDPALVFLNLSNENPLLYFWDRTPEAAGIYVEKYHAALRASGSDSEAERKARGSRFSRFLNEMQIALIRDQKRFLRDEIGVKALITDVNFLTQPVLTFLREELDLVDNHQYWDHPRFLGKSWQTPLGYRQESAISRFAEMPREMMPSRIPGRPFTVTEANFCHPNFYRMEGGPLTGGYAALQGWDALYRFDWSYLPSVAGGAGTGPSTFDIAGDPLALLSERIIHALFVRGDVREAETLYEYEVGRDAYEAIRNVSLGGVPMFPEEFSRLGLFARIGSKLTVGARSVQPAGDADFLKSLQEHLPLTSETGELTLDPGKNTFRVSTPLTETVTGAGTLSGGEVLSLRDGNTFQTVAVISRDGKALKSSRDMLLLHLPMIFRSETTFREKNGEVLLSSGRLPLLVRRGTGELALQLTPSENAPQVTMLSPYGHELGRVSGIKWENGRLSFTLDAGRIPGGVLAYSIKRE